MGRGLSEVGVSGKHFFYRRLNVFMRETIEKPSPLNNLCCAYVSMGVVAVFTSETHSRTMSKHIFWKTHHRTNNILTEMYRHVQPCVMLNKFSHRLLNLSLTLTQTSQPQYYMLFQGLGSVSILISQRLHTQKDI